MIFQRIRNIRLLTMVTLALAGSGCVVQSGQFSTIVGLFKNNALDLSDNSWSVTYGDYRALVYAVTIPEGTLFTNQAGDQIMFDGWSVRQVSGMGRGRIQLGINDNRGDRQYRRGNRLVAVHQCQPWQRRVNAGLTSFSQICSARGAGETGFKQGLKDRAIDHHAYNGRSSDSNNNGYDKSFGSSFSNSILVVEDGSISIIRQIVDERYTPLTLTKLK